MFNLESNITQQKIGFTQIVHWVTIPGNKNFDRQNQLSEMSINDGL